MSSTQVSRGAATEASGAVARPMRLEIVVVPVADVLRAKSFHQGLGWRLDADASAGDDSRVVQLTPPASNASIILGKGLTSAEPGSIDSHLLAVDDVRSHGVDVSEVFRDAGGGLGGGFQARTESRAPGPDPQGRSYASYASFSSDPDGNGGLLREITERLPGRV